MSPIYRDGKGSSQQHFRLVTIHDLHIAYGPTSITGHTKAEWQEIISLKPRWLLIRECVAGPVCLSDFTQEFARVVGPALWQVCIGGRVGLGNDMT